MTVRVAAALALLLGGSSFMVYLHWVGRGPWSSAEERNLRAAKERATVPGSLERFTFADFSALPHGRPLSEVQALERRGVSIEGYVQGMLVSSDGDFYLSLVDTASAALPVDRLPLTTEVTPQFHRGSNGWRWEALNAALRPYSGWFAPWPAPPPRVRISGWLLYDYQYDAPFLAPKRGLLPASQTRSRLTGWEIHPVTKIERWDDARAAFVELRR